MKAIQIALLGIMIGLILPACVSTKKYTQMEEQYQSKIDKTNKQLNECKDGLSDFKNQLKTCEEQKANLRDDLTRTQNTLNIREDQINDLKTQIEDIKKQRDKQLTQVGDLTALSQSASENIKQTLTQLEKKDKYIQFLMEARSKADSINLALAVNLKSVLKDGIEDKDIDVKVDKTVVFINLSDKMLYESGKSTLTPRANEVLGKIAEIVKSRPGLEVMVEGYTDNVPIKTDCIQDNWDLSVKRATSVVRSLQKNHSIDPNRLIAAGRGEFNTLASNATAEGRAMNRRTRIIILPKLNQFYDLLAPAKIPE